jgi:ABC-type Mn2+/Zn2+ transport system permease subunit
VPESRRGWHDWLENFWVWEVWQEIRPTFKRLVEDAVLFIVLMGSLSLGHYVIEWVPASPDRRAFLEGVHFYGITIVWIVLGVTLFIELIISFFKRFQESLRNRTRER